MRHMSAIWHQQGLETALAYFLGYADLSMRSIAVSVTAYDQHRDGDPGQILSEIECGKSGIEPDVIPSPKRDIDVLVITRKTLAQVARFECLACISDLGEGFRLNAKMRCHQNDTTHARICNISDIGGGHRSAVAVTEQKPPTKSDRFEDFRQDVERVTLHIIDRKGRHNRRRCAVAGARIDKYAGASLFENTTREFAPRADGAKSFVQHDDRR